MNKMITYPAELLIAYHSTPNKDTRGAVVVHTDKRLKAWDWENCQCRLDKQGRWVILSVKRFNHDTRNYTGVDFRELDSITCIEFAILPAGAIAAIHALAIFDIAGGFMGFANDSMYSKSLEAFCKRLFRLSLT